MQRSLLQSMQSCSGKTSRYLAHHGGGKAESTHARAADALFLSYSM